MFALFVIFSPTTFYLLVSTQSHNCPDNRSPVDTCLDQCPNGHVCMEGICCPTCSTIRSIADNGTTTDSRLLVPQCDSNGNYQAEQCDDTADVCYCVTELGKEISGTRLSRADSGRRQRPCPMERTFRFVDDKATIRTFDATASGTDVFATAGQKPTTVARCTSDQSSHNCIQQCFEAKDCSVLDNNVEWSCCWNGCATRCEAVHGKLGFSADRTSPVKDNDALFTKPGSCPASLPAFQTWSSLENCTIDDNCVGDNKCCLYTHGKKCVSPQQLQQQPIIQPIRGLDSKPGVCPSPMGISGSASLACTKDKDCPVDWKCCEDVGGLFCRIILPEPELFNPSLNQPVYPNRVNISATFKQSCRDPNEEFRNCGSSCPISCEDRTEPQWCQSAGCIPGCFCRNGFIRKNRGFGALCIPENQCPISPTASDNVVPSVSQSVEPRTGECPTIRLHPIVLQAITTRRVSHCTVDQSCPLGQKCCQVLQPLAFMEQRFCLCTDANAIWSDCGPVCTDICFRGQITRDSCQSTSQQCRPGCFCLPGYITDINDGNSRQCIRRHLCSVNATNPVLNDSRRTSVHTVANIKVQGTVAHPLVNGTADIEQVLLTKTILSGQIQGLKPGTTYILTLHGSGNISGDSCQSASDVTSSSHAQQAGPFNWQTAKPFANLSIADAAIQSGKKVQATTSFISDDNGEAHFSWAIDGNLDLGTDIFSTEDNRTLINRSLTLYEKLPNQQPFNSNDTEIVACGIAGSVRTVQ